ncbi:uncharacterized protein LOC122012174 isoform X1 [Zingiber officinale]|uniref:DUF7356 domain-containing protein n=1 Tax=Zingiber officinale TaxID=94328 RepID=A0A8J5FFX1_ZINOF|nr:uncharacterized protein LOC122012174 isoform X1 [Zingiber officinale]KAG6484748.1 hypothetical protein ZIOFF_053273 [Zingiber officinale]
MKKGVWVIFFAVLARILLDADRYASAAETNGTVTDTNIHVANPDTDKTIIVGKENKSPNLDKASQKNVNESLQGMRDKSLDEPKPASYGENHSVTTSTTPPLEDFLMEGCDSSDSCIDEKDKFVACLRVPGEDSTHLSLLIRNKGTKALDVKIVAPHLVHPEDTLVNVKPNLDREVKVFVKNGASDTTITLLAKDGNCSLKFQNTILISLKNGTPRMPNYLSLFSISIFLTAVAFAGAAWLSIRFWRKHASRYQKIDTVLPVSAGGTKEADESDDWDDSWGDGWDDEAPKTPSKPVSTPSSNGLASRKLNKDGWKD